MMITLLSASFTYREKVPALADGARRSPRSVRLAIQFIPVAPPRMYPQFGFVDVARLFDQSVYGLLGQGISDQLSAMPSVHVAWVTLGRGGGDRGRRTRAGGG